MMSVLLVEKAHAYSQAYSNFFSKVTQQNNKLTEIL